MKTWNRPYNKGVDIPATLWRFHMLNFTNPSSMSAFIMDSTTMFVRDTVYITNEYNSELADKMLNEWARNMHKNTGIAAQTILDEVRFRLMCRDDMSYGVGSSRFSSVVFYHVTRHFPDYFKGL